MMDQEIKTSTAAKRDHAHGSSRAQAVVMVGLSVAIIAVCSWITVPIGPVPFTLQMFAIPFTLCALSPARAIAATYAYVAIGAIGVPVFSGIRGGLAVLAGPTGGFLLGYLIGVPLAALFLWVVRRMRAKSKSPAQGIPHNGIVPGVIAGVIFTACAYVVGCIQYMAITGVAVQVALATCVLPFIIADIVKMVLAAVCANRVTAALAK